MAYKPIGPSKRKKELMRQEHQKQKAERKAQRQRERGASQASGDEAEDPDIAGIIPGPQPPIADDQ